MSESSIMLASHFINLGVSYYEEGKYEAALGLFVEALSVSKSALRFESFDGCSSSSLIDDMKVPLQPEIRGNHMFSIDDSNIMIFLNPMSVPPIKNLPRGRPYNLLTMITVYNMAICHHREAIRRNMDRHSLRKALQYYELAYSIQVNERIDMTLTPSMVIMSNVGHIHKILGHDEYANRCFQYLLATLMFVVESGEQHMVSGFDEFFSNIMNTMYAKHAPAAAA